MESKDLQEYYNKLQKKQQYITENMAYAYGKNYKIAMEKPVPKPDNRIATPLGKSAITDVVGYAGKPGELKTEYHNIINEETDDNITELLEDFDYYNREGIENSELLTRSLSLGIAWELWWISDEQQYSNGVMTPEYKILDNRECWPVYTKSLKPKLEKFIRFYGEDADSEADVYYPLYSEHWVKPVDEWVRVPELDTKYPYTQVPVIPYRTSINDVPVFEAQRSLIDAYDAIVSKTQNEVDRYNALITLFPAKVNSEFIKSLTEAAKPYIDQLDEYDPNQWPRYLEKNLSGVSEFYPRQADRLKSDFHETIKIPNMQDEAFAGNASGVAIAYKLIGFEFLISEIEIYFRLGLETRYKFYQDIINASTLKVNWGNYEQVIIWNRNLPVDAEAKVRIATMLKGLGYKAESITKFIPNTIIDGELDEEIKEDINRSGIEGLPSDIEQATEAVKLSGIQIAAANDIIGAVNRGELSRDAGIQQLIVFLGLTKEQAEKVMGKVIVKAVTNEP